MRRTFLLTALLTAAIYGHTQISMTLEVPPTGVIQKNQLWNILLVNNNVNATTIQISLVLTNMATNQVVLTGVSNKRILSTGANQIQSTDIAPIQYEYPTGIMDQDPNGFLPVGEYEACYTLSKQTLDYFEVVLEDCINITVEPLSPPILNTPNNEDDLEEDYPQFNWLPPAPLNIFTNLSYDLILVEVQQGQSPIEAIQQNIPSYTEGNLTNIFLNYPASNTALDTGKIYAWQVIAKDNNQYAAQSEVWTFKIKKEGNLNSVKDTIPYIKLRRHPDASISSCTGILKFVYENEADDQLISYRITSLEDEDLGVVLKSGSLSIKSGENLMDLPLLRDDRLIDNKTYFFELFNSRNEVWSMKFIYHNSEPQ